VNKTADWTDIESVTPTLPFVRDGVHGTADWTQVPGAPRPGTRAGTADGTQGTADWTDLLGD
jgi:hypothetical protein